MSHLDRELEERILPLYNKPQDEWGAEEWREFAMYAWARLEEANALRERLLEGWESANSMAQELLPMARKYRTVKVVLNEAASRGLLVLKEPRKQPGRKKSELNPVVVAALVTLAHRHGTRKAAQHLAQWQMLREGRDPSVYRIDYARRVRTWENKVPTYRRIVADDILREHGSGLAAYDQLARFGLLPDRRKREAKDSQK